MLKTAGILAASAALTASAGAGTATAQPTTQPSAKAPVTTAAPAKPATSAKAGDIVMPPMPTDSTGTSGQVNFMLINNSSQTVTFNVNVSSDAQMETSLYSFQSGVFTDNPQVAPGQTLVVPVVAGGGGRTDSSDPVVTVGVEGYAAFEMWVHVNTWTNSDFQNIEYKGDQTGGGNTGGLAQVNCGSGQIISDGNAGTNNDYTYDNGTSACFSITN